jgi:hypothetical protein
LPIIEIMMRGSWNNDPELLIENSLHGVIRVARLAELGVPPDTAYRRCRPEGPWQRLLPGIVSLYKGPPSRDQLVAAARLYAGEGAVLTGEVACRTFGLRNVPESETVHLLTPHDRKVHSSGFVLIERTHRLPEAQRRGGLQVAPPSRAVLDTARRMTEVRPARALLTESVQRRFTTVGELTAELAQGSSRGSALPRRILTELAPGQESVAEMDARRVWRRSGLPEPLWNRRLVLADGRFVAKPDAWFEDVGLAWEIDSLAFHLGAGDFDRTLVRNGRYAAAGILVLQTLPSRLRTEPDAVIAELQAAHRAAAARPRPAVLVLAS